MIWYLDRGKKYNRKLWPLYDTLMSKGLVTKAVYRSQNSDELDEWKKEAGRLKTDLKDDMSFDEKAYEAKMEPVREQIREIENEIQALDKEFGMYQAAVNYLTQGKKEYRSQIEQALYPIKRKTWGKNIRPEADDAADTYVPRKQNIYEVQPEYEKELPEESQEISMEEIHAKLLKNASQAQDERSRVKKQPVRDDDFCI